MRSARDNARDTRGHNRWGVRPRNRAADTNQKPKVSPHLLVPGGLDKLRPSSTHPYGRRDNPCLVTGGMVARVEAPFRGSGPLLLRGTSLSSNLLESRVCQAEMCRPINPAEGSVQVKDDNAWKARCVLFCLTLDPHC